MAALSLSFAAAAPAPGGGGSSTTTPVPTSANACNGHVEYCSRKWSNLSQIVSHDSAFVGGIATDNQHKTVTEQLNLGIRFLQAQTHKAIIGSDIHMCHTSCWELDAGSLNSYLTTIKTWLDANPREVLALLIVNGDFLTVGNYSPVFSSVGLDTYAYAPSKLPALGDWPTLQQFIDMGKRLIVFMDYTTDITKVPYILPEFQMFFETPYDVTDATKLTECTIDRPSGASASGRMGLINHFLDYSILGIDVPDEAKADTTNSAASILTQAYACAKLNGNAPKGVLVDWMEKGDVFAAERTLNGL
ncbi:PLC-like phosphodiesterase [Zopfochytrium polystomum]|nr:PLC-like phosphodiesterase [Zopfochytrium polystomum]